MKYDVFMRTRTNNGDYDWVNKPDYLPANIHETCRTIIALCEKSSFDDLVGDDWNSNFFYLRRGGYCLLARVAKTKYTASDNHGIISFEGISVRTENERHLFYNIPSLINELLPPNKSFRTIFEEDGFIPQFFDIQSLLNPFDGYKIPEEVHPLLINNAAYRNLLKFTAFTSEPAGFIFGKNARAFSEYVDKEGLRIEYVFDFDNPDPVTVDEYAFSDSYSPIVCNYKKPESTGSDKVAINLLVLETGNNTYKYRWEVKPWDSNIKDFKRVRYVTKFFEIDDKVELVKLELQKESIKKFLVDSGWTKQGVGLRFEKDLFQREGI